MTHKFFSAKVISFALFTLMSLLLFSGCREKRISYVEMIEREDGEIADFMNRNSFTQIGSFPNGLVTQEKTFVKVDDGLFIRVVKSGNIKPVNGRTIISSRFNVESITSREKFAFNLYGPTSGGTAPLTFVYYDTSERLEISPKASPDEASNQPYLSRALLEAASIAGVDGAEVQIISSFRFGPSFTTQNGIPVFYSTVHLDLAR